MVNNEEFFFQILIENQKHIWVRNIDSSKIFSWVDGLFLILFPEKPLEINELKSLMYANKMGLFILISKISKNKSKDEVSELTNSFYDKLPDLYNSLQKDAMAILETDPAADCIAEILNSYPGFLAIAFYRIAHSISEMNVELLPRIISEYAHSKTGIDIHPKAKIGVPFVIDHGTGIVIGETAVIGKNVCIYQGVTLGALQVYKDMEETKRHPTVEDNVVIYANATILGGSTTIGNHSIIGGNTFVTKSVNPFTMVMQSTKNNIINQPESVENNFFSI